MNCKFCNKQFKINLENNSYWMNTIRKIFCSRDCKNKWHHKYNYKVIKAIKKARRKYDNLPSSKIKKHEYFKKTYIPNPRILLTEKEKRIRKRLWDRNRKYRMRKINPSLTLDLIQMIYEDNIKRYGTLTCIYCLNAIQFGNDTLEHKTPLSRGGTNEYQNLAIACFGCNNKKNTKTYEEYINLFNHNNIILPNTP